MPFLTSRILEKKRGLMQFILHISSATGVVKSTIQKKQLTSHLLRLYIADGEARLKTNRELTKLELQAYNWKHNLALLSNVR